MKKNNTLIVKLLTLNLIILTSNSVCSKDYNFITTPELIKRTQEAFNMCREFGVYPASPENNVYWSESPRTDKRTEKSLNIAYLRQIEAEAKQAKHDYIEQQKKALLYRDDQEHQRKLKIAQREEEREYYAYLREQRLMTKAYARSPESPDSCIVTWKEDLPIFYTHTATSEPIKSIEIDTTSAEVSSDGPPTNSTTSSHASSLSQDFGGCVADNKENINNQTALTSHDISKSERSLDKIITSQKLTVKFTATDGSHENTTPTQLDSYPTSPLRKKARRKIKSPFFPHQAY